jgi:hypothetical protein
MKNRDQSGELWRHGMVVRELSYKPKSQFLRNLLGLMRVNPEIVLSRSELIKLGLAHL